MHLGLCVIQQTLKTGVAHAAAEWAPECHVARVPADARPVAGAVGDWLATTG